MVDEWNARVLTIHSVAGNAVMRKSFLAVGPGLWRIGQRILLVFVADEDSDAWRRLWSSSPVFPEGSLCTRPIQRGKWRR